MTEQTDLVIAALQGLESRVDALHADLRAHMAEENTEFREIQKATGDIREKVAKIKAQQQSLARQRGEATTISAVVVAVVEGLRHLLHT